MSYSSVTGNKDKQPPSSSVTGVREENRCKVKDTFGSSTEEKSQKDNKSIDPSSIEQADLTDSLRTVPFETSQPDEGIVQKVISRTSGEDERMKQIEKVLMFVAFSPSVIITSMKYLCIRIIVSRGLRDIL